MSEIRLQCPECGTEYRIPQSAIPDQGRQVECTSCDHIWMAFAEKPGGDKALTRNSGGSATSTGGDTPGNIRQSPDSETDDETARTRAFDLAPIERRIPEDVLNIFREEVAFERRARRGEITMTSTDQSARAEAEESWPATTVTDAGAVPDFRPAPHATPVPELASEVTTEHKVVAPVTGPLPLASAQPEALSTKQPRRTGYFFGFGLALAIAATAFAAYVIAPDYADHDRFGPSLSQYRDMVDAGRNWLDIQASRLTRNN